MDRMDRDGMGFEIKHYNYETMYYFYDSFFPQFFSRQK